MNPEDKEFGDQAFLKQSRKLLDESVDSLDGATLSRLNQARQKALDTHGNTRRAHFLLSSRTGAVFASFAVAATVVLLWTTMPQESQQQHMAQLNMAQQYEDMEMLTANADLELLEDLDFVSWLVEENLDLNLDSDVELNDAG